MTNDEAKEVQKFILRLIGDHLEQMAVHELKILETNSGTSRKLWEYYRNWNKELEALYKKNSFYIKNGELNKVETPMRKTPADF